MSIFTSMSESVRLILVGSAFVAAAVFMRSMMSLFRSPARQDHDAK